MGDFDIEACGGTHCDNTSELKQVKILRATKIQDGVVRLEFVAGDAAKEAKEEAKGTYSEVLKPLSGLVCEAVATGYSEEDMNKAAEVFSVPLVQLPATMQRFVSEWQAYGEKIRILGGKAPESRILDQDKLSKVAETLFSEWKKREKELKNLINQRIQEEIKDLPADEPKLRGIFFGMRMKDLTEDPRTELEKTMERVKKVKNKNL
jgi:hypothetical protein